MRVTLLFSGSDYSAFTGGSISFPLTERQAAFLLSLLPLMLYREAWQPMSDATWQALENEISELIGTLQ